MQNQVYALANSANLGNLAIFSSGEMLSSKKMSLMFAFFLLFLSSFLSAAAGAASPATDAMSWSTDACIAVGSAPFWAKDGCAGAPKPGRGGSAEGGCPGAAPLGAKGGVAVGWGG